MYNTSAMFDKTNGGADMVTTAESFETRHIYCQTGLCYNKWVRFKYLVDHLVNQCSCMVWMSCSHSVSQPQLWFDPVVGPASLLSSETAMYLGQNTSLFEVTNI